MKTTNIKIYEEWNISCPYCDELHEGRGMQGKVIKCKNLDCEKEFKVLMKLWR